MSIIVNEGATFEPHPEGQFRAVCVDVVERHAVETAYGPKNKIRPGAAGDPRGSGPAESLRRLPVGVGGRDR